MIMNDLDKERQTEGRKAWYAVQTFYCKEEHLGKYLEKKGVNYFIPMRYIEHETLDGKKHRKLTPAVHNLLFIEKEFTEKELLERVKDCTIPFLLVRDRSHGGVMRFQTVRCWNSVPYAILIIKELFMSIQ